jgi:hypothetical protein
MKARKPSIYGLDEFGLSMAQLTSLGSAKIKLHVSLRHVNEKALFKLPPSQRLEKMKRYYELLLSRVKRNWRDGPLDISWIRRQPRGFSASVEAKRVSRLLRMPEIDSIWLHEIPGRERVSAKPKERWFAVKARFAIQVEGQTMGLQSYEDRIVIVQAASFEEAKRKLQPEFRQYATPYLNPRGLMVRWSFERVLDGYEIADEEIDPRGVEVFSALAQRRMKPEFAWKLKRKEQVNTK